MITPKLNLLRDHGMDGEFNLWIKENNLGNDVFKLHFKTENKKLTYIGTKYIDNLKSKTFNVIKDIISNNFFDLIIVEGVPYDKGLNPDLNRSGWEYEMSFAIDLAKNHNINYAGIEPLDKDIYNKLLPEYKIEDLMLFEALREYKLSYQSKKDYHFFMHMINNIIVPYISKILGYVNFNFNFLEYFKLKYKIYY